MLEDIRKILLSGFGAVLLTKEKAEEATRRLVDEAKISKEDAGKLIDDLFETGSRQWSDMEADVSRAVRKGIDTLDVAGKRELHGLKSKVGKLEKRIEKLERQMTADRES